MSFAARLDRVLNTLPQTYAGPGGAVAVLKDGKPIVRHTWGWSNLERRLPFTPQSLFRICSITKHFTCALIRDAFPDMSVLDADVKARLPHLEGAIPTAQQLAHNQSGLKDYWAVAMLMGGLAETPFADRETARLINNTRGRQFAPGSRYSYCNQNFRILSDILTARTGRSYAELIRARIFGPVGMTSAFIAADTRSMPDGSDGYEGTVATGFRPAANGMFWSGGDASIGASLDDMIAWEAFIDATRDDVKGLYRRISEPVTFNDGAVAGYGYGLARETVSGRQSTRHGGALRGWRSQRVHLADERLSVVVMFNHDASPGAAADEILSAILGIEKPAEGSALPAPAWLGTYLEPETGLSVRLTKSGPRQIQLHYATGPETLTLLDDGSAVQDRSGTRIRPTTDGIWLDIPADNQRSLLVARNGEAKADFAGTYHCAELGATLDIADAGGALYAACSGALGDGRMEQLEAIGRDLWVMPCPRGIDHFPPGDWTIDLQRDSAGKVTGLQLGCWLARKFDYRRQ
ncbi:D-aminopeptidase [Dongia sp.]|uniref:D-aminopeptidase n=1 Tax=Dongia sp. TaxID=1977262 RepID=UPI0035B1DA95